MKFFRLDLLTLLISLFILNSCKNQDTIGLGVNSTDQLHGALTDTVTINANTTLDDSVATSGLSQFPLSYFKDPVVGTTEANLAGLLSLPNSSAYTLPSGTLTLDSAVLIMRYADGFYGDSLTSRYKVNVYQLNEKPSSSTAYYNTKQWNYNSGALLGSVTFNSRTHTPVSVYNIIAGKADTLYKMKPHLRIPIDMNFIRNNVINASSSVLGSNTLFQSIVKGLYITLDKNQTTGDGGNFMFRVDTIPSIKVFYRANSGTKIDTSFFELPLTLRAAQIKHTYSTDVQGAINNTQPNAKVYLQGLAGLRTKIAFPYLKNLANQGDSTVVLNRADLIVTPDPGSGIPYVPAPRLTLYRLDLAKQRAGISDQGTLDPRSAGLGTFGGYYDKTKKEYHFIITTYIADLMSGRITDYGTYIAPTDTISKTSLSITPSAQSAGRTIAIGTDKSSPYRIKLNLIYTKVRK